MKFSRARENEGFLRALPRCRYEAEKGWFGALQKKFFWVSKMGVFEGEAVGCKLLAVSGMENRISKNGFFGNICQPNGWLGISGEGLVNWGDE